MTKEKFAEILTESGYTTYLIDMLWAGRPPGVADSMKEKDVRATAKLMAPGKDRYLPK